MAAAQRGFSWQAYVGLAGQEPSVALGEVFRLLGRVQDTFGSVPRCVVVDVARRAGMSEARLYGALTAYPGSRLLREA